LSVQAVQAVWEPQMARMVATRLSIVRLFVPVAGDSVVFMWRLELLRVVVSVVRKEVLQVPVTVFAKVGWVPPASAIQELLPGPVEGAMREGHWEPELVRTSPALQTPAAILDGSLVAVAPEH
jgi:hypothetical protein